MAKFIHQHKGAAVIEFVIAVPLLLLLIFGVIETGLIFWGNSTLNFATSYAARYAFVYPKNSAQSIQSFAQSQITTLQPSFTFNATINPDNSADITGTFTYKFLVLPFSPITLSTRVHQVRPITSS